MATRVSARVFAELQKSRQLLVSHPADNINPNVTACNRSGSTEIIVEPSRAWVSVHRWGRVLCYP